MDDRCVRCGQHKASTIHHVWSAVTEIMMAAHVFEPPSNEGWMGAEHQKQIADKFADAALRLADISSVQRVQLQPGDVLVIRAPSADLRRDQWERNRKALTDFANQAWPGHRCVVLPSEITLAAVSASAASDAEQQAHREEIERQRMESMNRARTTLGAFVRQEKPVDADDVKPDCVAGNITPEEMDAAAKRTWSYLPDA